MLRSGENGLHDGLRRGNGCWSHVRHFLLSQDWDAWQGADGRRGKDHDAKRRDVRHLHVHRDGNTLLRVWRRSHLHHTVKQLWDFSNNYVLSLSLRQSSFCQ
ncbi:hypothetical protein F7725_016397 [Dissostichus mawsoni]|uniref:Uncharacterized protein n=1 Tax=Dissostichus mawsoni TaxID=36200 RepID=A0A7J5Z1K5_DISMA|nr:hypothetical protein F7725_016397 [Dissostichus mawsoni]